MSTIQQHLSGITWSSPETAVVQSNLNLLLGSVRMPVSNLVRKIESPSDIKEIKAMYESTRRGGLYCEYIGASSKVLRQFGNEVSLSNVVRVPFLPFISMVGKVGAYTVDGNKVNATINLDEGVNFKFGFVLNDGKSHDNKIYALEMWMGDELDVPFRAEIVNKASYAAAQFIDQEGDSRDFILSDLQGLVGKTVIAGIMPKHDYLICDPGLEGNTWSHQCAWYFENGVPVVDAIMF